MMQTDSFRLTVDDAVAELVLTRGEQLNTLRDAFWGELSDALEQLDATPSVRALVIKAEGPHFCAGMDLDFFRAVREKEQAEAGRYREWLRRKIRYLQKPMDQLEALRFPVIAATQGACIGAGLDLVCAADLRLCAADGFYGIHEINVGITADLGVLQRMPTLISPAVVDELALTGRRLPAEEAKATGFISRVEPTIEALHAAADDMARRIAGLSPLAVAGTKTALRRNRRAQVSDGLDYMTVWNAAMFVTDDVPEAIAAQQGKRATRFEDLLA
ncbi:enoyl-CoA hydratase-related protein [uncultured Abyssibacter sp.]|uniref:enoyl-CoA hydratase-related protein n=1 Tax=uncultured Abyssibacter sp. TaxID=2320202 RepID=UPI0032B2310C